MADNKGEPKVGTPSSGSNLPDSEKGPETESERFINELYEAALDARTDQTIVDLMYYSGATFMYPYKKTQIENHNKIATRYSHLISKENISNVLRLYDRSDPRVRLFLTASLPVYLANQLDETYATINQFRNNEGDGGLWSNIQNNGDHTFSEGIAYLDSQTKVQGGRWERYSVFRTNYLTSNIPDLDSRFEFYTRLFDTVENELSKAESEILFQMIKELKELGFNSVDEYVELFTVTPLEQINKDMEIVAQTFAVDSQTEAIPYMLRANRMIQREELRPGLVPETLVQELFNLHGIDNPEDMIALITDPIPSLSGGRYYMRPTVPSFMDLFPHTDFTQLRHWDEFMDKSFFLVSRAELKTSDQLRAYVHEYGHALQFILLQLTMPQNDAILRLLDSSTIKTEIFSTYFESFSPHRIHFKSNAQFLIARYVGLARHQANLWRLGERVVNGDLSRDQFYEEARESYQTTLGTIMNAEMPTGRFLRDGFVESGGDRWPFRDSASYVYGYIISLYLRDQVDKLGSPEEKKAFLQRVAKIVDGTPDVSELFDKLGTSMQEAVGIAERSLA